MTSLSCFKCWGIGIFSRYCSGLERCAWCAGGHDSRTCPHRAPPPPPPATGDHTPPPPPVDTTHWRCPRCQEPGVSVWHGCARRKAAVPSTPAPPPPPPLSLAATPLVPPASPSPQVQALRIAVDKLMTRCASLESRLALSMPGLLVWLPAKPTLKSPSIPWQSHRKFLISAVTLLTEKLDSFASRFEDSSARAGPSPKPPGLAASSSTFGSRYKKHTVR
ncbi:hypothetical protein GWK47_022039 [Chionoecetes opilio]|uniref:Uncharacterized protein n=1 Tax=Chionoecetes opilio TaxID=41210 RepID=A0A8J4XSK7_CHIOP|nr:hypothetical protein GWK47_022039 [Chionoecetes opilio]